MFGSNVAPKRRAKKEPRTQPKICKDCKRPAAGYWITCPSCNKKFDDYEQSEVL